ncbi:MAG: hypothetical protein ACI9NT_000467 [Bacteroidia bacterium]|jgi:hypothetical protein
MCVAETSGFGAIALRQTFEDTPLATNAVSNGQKTEIL